MKDRTLSLRGHTKPIENIKKKIVKDMSFQCTAV